MITLLLVFLLKLTAFAFFVLGFLNFFPELKETNTIKTLEPWYEPLLKAIRAKVPSDSFDLSYWVASVGFFILGVIVDVLF